MARSTTPAKQTADKPNWPDNLMFNAPISFPIWAEQMIGKIVEWRAKNNIAKPKFDDRVGYKVMLTQEDEDKIVDYLLNVHYPFARTLKDFGYSHVEDERLDVLVDLVKQRKWSAKEYNLPIRPLSDKEKAATEDEGTGYVSKLSVIGPKDDEPLDVRAIQKDAEGVRRATSLWVPSVLAKTGDKVDEFGSPSSGPYIDLWWGGNWPFRHSIRFGSYDSAKLGTSAYANTVWLLADAELPKYEGGGAQEAQVVAEDGDWGDWD